MTGEDILSTKKAPFLESKDETGLAGTEVLLYGGGERWL